jgi:hypothetical protein
MKHFQKPMGVLELFERILFNKTMTESLLITYQILLLFVLR